MRQTLPACNRRQCPLADAAGHGFPCVMKETVEANGGAIESCPMPFVANAEVRERYLVALRTGELGGLDEMAAASLAAQTGLAGSELKKLFDEGLSIKEDIYGPDGALVGHVQRKNPRAEPTLKLLEMIGHTAKQQGVTRESQGERKRDDSISGFLGSLAELHKKHGVPLQELPAGRDSE